MTFLACALALAFGAGDAPPPDASAKKVRALRAAISDLASTFGDRYPHGDAFLERLKRLEANPSAKELARLEKDALLSNPLLDSGRILVVRRGRKSPAMGLPANWQGNCALKRSPTYDDEIAILENGKLTTVYRPKRRDFVGDVDLHWDGGKLLFSSIGSENRWHIFEVRLDGTGLRQVTPGGQNLYDSYDACYLPDERILFTSTAGLNAVPCVGGGSRVANICLMNPDGSGIRQLCFDQDHDWNPSVLNDGSVVYLRWEYTDTPHSNTRILFRMNPDGTNQSAIYGSNSYWPNGIFYPRAVPGHPTKIVGIVTGHHGSRRMGEMVLFDHAAGHREATGAIHRFPQSGGTIEAVVADRLVDRSWPKFLHPWPLSEKYFLVSACPGPKSAWGIYLVDIFDNMTLLAEHPGSALLEPVPLQPRPRPPAIPDKVDLESRHGLVNLTDIYTGGGLKGVPRGTVKSLRIFTYHYCYPGMGGLLGTVGADGPWDIKRVLGTVPVERDGSAMFRVPANTPIAIQPLDREGKALQLMRSWFTAMPGEVLSCSGCHEGPNDASPNLRTVAASKPPAEITPWRGPVRGFHYPREVQPVLDRLCTGCHAQGAKGFDPARMPDLTGAPPDERYEMLCPGSGTKRIPGRRFSKSYLALHPLVRRPGIESYYHMLTPLEFHADTTELVQMLRKGHHGVKLDEEAWDRIVTWIDLNAPYYGTWTEIMGTKMVAAHAKARRELMSRFAGLSGDPESRPAPAAPAAFVPPEPLPAIARNVTAKGWPFDAKEAAKRQAAAAERTSRVIDLGGGITLKMRLIPPGAFVMGDPDGSPDESPLARVTIGRPFWMGECEVTNAQFARFDPDHDSLVESKLHYQFGITGYPMNEPAQPVVRVSWKNAAAFCRWLSERTGESFTLPTEAEWEYACRAGTATPFSFGAREADFSKHANLADRSLSKMASNPYTLLQPMKQRPTRFDDYVPKDRRFDDGAIVSVETGRYAPNAWGLRDMHGNVAEWTRSAFRPYPYRPDDGRNAATDEGRKVVRGGSWRDRPARCASGFRWGYPAWQSVFNVGFRVVCRMPE